MAFKRFTLTIENGSSAFDTHDLQGQLQLLLDTVSVEIRGCGIHWTHGEGELKDLNGNRCGSWEIETD